MLCNFLHLITCIMPKLLLCIVVECSLPFIIQFTYNGNVQHTTLFRIHVNMTKKV